MSRRFRFDPAEGSYRPNRVNRPGANSDGADSTIEGTIQQSRLRQLSQTDRDAQASRVDNVINQLGQSQAQSAPIDLTQNVVLPEGGGAIVPYVPESLPVELDASTFDRLARTAIASRMRREAIAVPGLPDTSFPPVSSSSFEATPMRPASVYGNATVAPEVAGTQQLFTVASYPNVGYEQEQIPRYPRTFSEAQLDDYVAEGRRRAAAAGGYDPEAMPQFDQNRVDYRTNEQVRIGAPVVGYDPTINALKIDSSPFAQFVKGVGKGYQNQHVVGDYNDWPVAGGKGPSGAYSRSYIADKMTGNNSPYLYNERPMAEKVGVEFGRIAGDITGHGTRKHFWTIQPEDITNTYGSRALSAYTNMNPAVRRTAAWAASNTLGMLSGNYNPLNFEGGGRAAGYAAVSPTEEDPRKSENPLLDMTLYRGMMGRSGRLLPWEEFHAERPDVSFEDYDKYKAYLREPGTLGLVKGTMEGIDGPEARILGYRVSPLGVLGAGTVLGGTLIAGRRLMR